MLLSMSTLHISLFSFNGIEPNASSDYDLADVHFGSRQEIFFSFLHRDVLVSRELQHRSTDTRVGLSEILRCQVFEAQSPCPS